MTRTPTVIVLIATLLGGPLSVAALASDPRGPDDRFLREYWYQPGIEHGNPRFDGRFRVNAPEVVLDSRFMYRSEVRENGLMMISIEEDLARLEGAELYLELWGGHPKSGEKRVAVNGRSTHVLPDVGTAHSCTHSYPTVPLKITDLVNGYNAFQFAVDQGETFWGHFIVDNAALRVELAPDHPDLVAAGLGGFEARVSAALGAGETLELQLETDDVSRIARVDFLGAYLGYDENGDTQARDWHGFTKDRKPEAHVGSATTAPFGATWDVTMLPAQQRMEARAVVRFRDHPDLLYVTAPLSGLGTPARGGATVSVHHCRDLPKPFWSRAGNLNACEIDLGLDPAEVERVELHVVLWDGGAGVVEDYFTLNGHSLAVAGEGHHDVLYRVVPLEPGLLRQGPNRIELLSDTEHHGIEILLPGPAIVVRTRDDEDGGTQ